MSKETKDQYKKPTQEQIYKLRPSHVDGLTSFDIDGLANYIQTNHCKNIILLFGAGISCAAGIPDFRTPGTGLYYNLQRFKLPNPQSIFEINFFKKNPQPFFELSKETMPGKYKPTFAHYLPVILHRHNLLKRVYTQNIDGLERLAGLPSDKIVECHGTYYTAHCLKCKQKYDFKDIQKKMEKGKIPFCTACKGGVIKPDIVFFGEDLPENFFNLIKIDFINCDCLIVMGTSLQVGPVNTLPSLVGADVPRILFNNEVVNTYDEKLKIIEGKNGQETLSEYFLNPDNFYFKFDHVLNRRDIFVKGDSQKNVYELIKKLGWEDEYASIVPNEVFMKILE